MHSLFRDNCYLKVHNVHLNLALPIWDKLSRDTIHFSTVAVHCRDPPETVFDQTLAHIYHKGDIAKLEILMTYGGIYLDTDVLVLRSMDQLRKHPLTLGREIPPKFIAGIIVAHKDALFLKLWLVR